MLKVLLKKQFIESFKGYFYDAKKNRMRPKGQIVLWFVFFTAILIYFAGMFASLAGSLCAPLTQAGMGWLYFLLMGGLSILVGTFLGVFLTRSGLYLAKDNDLLLSLPIPVRTIITARLLNVYSMGGIYSAIVYIPALVVFWVTAGATVSGVLCQILLLLIVTAFVLSLSCLLGWVVARISLRVKNKSFVSLAFVVAFLVLYYAAFFRANGFLTELLQNAPSYAGRIRSASEAFYLFGRVGEGDWFAAAVFLAVAAVLFALVWRILSRSFLRIATSSGSAGKARYAEKRTREKSPFAALLTKELRRFTASTGYMLNCGLGVLLIPVGGVLLLIRGAGIAAAIDGVFAARPGVSAVLLCTVLCMLSTMNDMAAPSVSLEGKTLWLAQSLPVHPKVALRAKAAAQLLLTAPPLLFAGVCAAVVAEGTLAVKLLLCLMPLAFAAFLAVACTVVGVQMPLLNWTNELAPIKQSGAVLLALFGAWLLCAAFAGAYLLIGYRLGAALYLLLWTVLLSAAAIALLRWMDTRGAAAFAAL